MADHALLLQALRSFAVTMGGSYDLTEMCYELSDRAAEAVGADGAGVSVVDASGILKFVTASNDLIVQMEEIQEKAQQGPCVAAFSSQEPVAVTGMGEIQEWPDYAEVAERLGISAVVGFPLSYNDHRLGAVNVYSLELRRWSAEDLDVLGVFADMATAYLVRTSELAEARQLSQQLQGALDSRVIVEQAKGLLAGELGISVDEAFDRLRSHSRSNNRRLTDVAHEVVHEAFRIS
jgi:GAF domain-containing protein